MPEAPFRGPLFIVGRPRSGTKLLRTLLNEHPEIGIPISETNFIPTMVRRYGNPPHFADSPQQFRDFYKRFAQSRFFDWRRKAGIVLGESELQTAADLNSWSSIIEVILRFYSPKGPHASAIWGDKSPSYLTEMPLLKELFPVGRFIHIIRDPRDHCASVKKAWGKSVVRSASVWAREVASAHKVGTALGDDYLEVQFEALLSEPEQALHQICEFLSIAYDPAMLQPQVSHEDRGDAAGVLAIVPQNKGKYLETLTPKKVKRIEEVTYLVAGRLGYDPEFATRHRPLGQMTETLYRVGDGIRLGLFEAMEHGSASGMRHTLDRIRRR